MKIKVKEHKKVTGVTVHIPLKENQAKQLKDVFEGLEAYHISEVYISCGEESPQEFLALEFHQNSNVD